MNESSIKVHSSKVADTNIQCSSKEEMLNLANSIPLETYIDEKNRLKVDVNTSHYEGAAFIDPYIIYLGNMPIRNIYSQSFGVKKEDASFLQHVLMQTMEINSKLKFGCWVMEEAENAYFFKVYVHAPIELEHHFIRYITLSVTTFFHLYDDLFEKQNT